MVIERDYNSDLGVLGVPIQGSILVHHMNPLVEKDLDFCLVWKPHWVLFNPFCLFSLQEGKRGVWSSQELN